MTHITTRHIWRDLSQIEKYSARLICLLFETVFRLCTFLWWFGHIFNIENHIVNWTIKVKVVFGRDAKESKSIWQSVFNRFFSINCTVVITLIHSSELKINNETHVTGCGVCQAAMVPGISILIKSHQMILFISNYKRFKLKEKFLRE